ncbi:hypothetical protein BDA96_07G107200, partial [Sorghum bicolor]
CLIIAWRAAPSPSRASPPTLPLLLSSLNSGLTELRNLGFPPLQVITKVQNGGKGYGMTENCWILSLEYLQKGHACLFKWSTCLRS